MECPQDISRRETLNKGILSKVSTFKSILKKDESGEMREGGTNKKTILSPKHLNINEALQKFETLTVLTRFLFRVKSSKVKKTNHRKN